MTGSIKARKVTVATDVRIEAEPHYSFLRCWHRHADDAERIACRVKSAGKWAREFMEFVRDHRSQDLVGLDVVTVTEDRCSACDTKWETMAGEGDDTGKLLCAYCGVEVET